MKTQLSFADLAKIETELLAVAAADTQTSKEPDAKAGARAADGK